jgi:hypothetical protein
MEDLDRGHVVGLDQELAIGTEPPDHAHLGSGLDQRQRREHHLLAGPGEIPTEADPVFRTQLPALGTDGLPQVDDVRGAIRNSGVEALNRLPGPEVLAGADGETGAGCHEGLSLYRAHCHGRW